MVKNNRDSLCVTCSDFSSSAFLSLKICVYTLLCISLFHSAYTYMVHLVAPHPCFLNLSCSQCSSPGFVPCMWHMHMGFGPFVRDTELSPIWRTCGALGESCNVRMCRNTETTLHTTYYAALVHVQIGSACCWAGFLEYVMPLCLK